MVLNCHGGEVKDKIQYDFSVNVNPLGMPDYVRQAILESIDSLCEYPDRLCTDLRNCIAKHEGIKANQVLCGNGASELIMAICAFLANETISLKTHGRINALIQAPTFSGYERAVKAYGGEAVYYRSLDEAITILKDRIKRNGQRIEAEPIDIIFICNPNNPTGETANRNELIQILDIARLNNILVFIDECFIDFTHEESLVCKADYDNLIVLKAFTKFYALAGARLGFICSSSELCDKISKYLPEWNVSAVAQAAGIAAFLDKERTAKWKQGTLGLIDEERSYLVTGLQSLGFKVSASKANFLLCKSGDLNIYEKLKSAGILVRDCSNFNGLNSSYIRICVSTHEKNEILIDTLKGLV